MSDASRWLLLHGTPLTPAVWDGVRPTLAEVRPVLAPLLPTPSGPTDAQAEVADRVMDDIDEGVGLLHVVGHSFGGQVALEVALRHPQMIASLTVLCSRASPFPAFAATASSLRNGQEVDPDSSIQRWFLPDEVQANSTAVQYARRCIVAADTRMWADELDAIAGYDRRQLLASLAMPTTVIAADHDHVGTPEEMSAMAAAINGARYVEVPDASHMSQFIDPAALAQRLIAAASV